MSHDWPDLMPLVEGFLKEAGSVVKALRARCKELPPGMGYGHVWFNPDTKQVWVSVGDWEEHPEDWREPLSSVKGVKDVRVEAECSPPKEESWVRVKCGHSTTLHALAQLANFVPGPTNALYGGPSPVAAMLAGGLLGAGTGYGLGYTGEQVLPDEQFRPGRLRKTMAALGGLAGVAPGLWWASTSYRHHPGGGGLKAIFSGWPFRKADEHGPLGPQPFPAELPELANRPGTDPLQFSNTVKQATDAARALLGGPEPHYKQAVEDYGLQGLAAVPMIPAQQFAQTVWQDQRTPANIRAATTGLVDSASAVRGGVNLVSPMDIARIGVGMGSGYLSGLLVGKTLGALAGLRPEAQRTLQQAGTWAGILSNVVPLAFAGR